jgi:hypothetical protein
MRAVSQAAASSVKKLNSALTSGAERPLPQNARNQSAQKRDTE